MTGFDPGKELNLVPHNVMVWSILFCFDNWNSKHGYSGTRIKNFTLSNFLVKLLWLKCIFTSLPTISRYNPSTIMSGMQSCLYFYTGLTKWCLILMLIMRRAWADDSSKMSQKCQKCQNCGISWQDLESPWEMHWNKYKHAWYWFINLWSTC